MKDGTLYTGCTGDLRKRSAQHNAGKNVATRAKKPFRLLYYEAFADKHDAFMREQYLKTGWGRRYISRVIANALAKVVADK